MELRHLRALGIHVHRPLSLRLLDDASKGDSAPTHLELAGALGAIGTWLTRMWLAERPMAGINKAAAELSNLKGPGPEENYVDYWTSQIRRRQNTRVGVPNDEDVTRGVRTRKAHGGSATQSSTAVLCALMEAEHGEESPARKHLTIEHVMPQKLTSAWVETLGDDAAETHERWLHRLANLTLSGDVTNAKLGTGTFEEKRSIYEKSPIGLTREIAAEDQWDRESLERRADALAGRVLRRWPWQGQGPEPPSSGTSRPLEWRIENGPWHVAESASQMVLNVVGALLTREPGNAERLSGDALSKDLQSARHYPPGSKAGTLTMRAIPGRRGLAPRGGLDQGAVRAPSDHPGRPWRGRQGRTGRRSVTVSGPRGRQPAHSARRSSCSADTNVANSARRLGTSFRAVRHTRFTSMSS